MTLLPTPPLGSQHRESERRRHRRRKSNRRRLLLRMDGMIVFFTVPSPSVRSFPPSPSAMTVPPFARHRRRRREWVGG